MIICVSVSYRTSFETKEININVSMDYSTNTMKVSCKQSCTTTCYTHFFRSSLKGKKNIIIIYNKLIKFKTKKKDNNFNVKKKRTKKNSKKI